MRDKLVDPIDEATVQRITTRIGETLRRPPDARPGRWRATPGALVLGLGCALALLVALASWRSNDTGAPSAESNRPERSDDQRPEASDGDRSEATLAFAPGAKEAGYAFRGRWHAEERSRSLELADGSRVELLPGAQLHVLVNDEAELSLRTQGTVHFDVEPGGPRTWRIDAGLANVEVLGTRFVVAQSEGRVRVGVERGHVRVRSPLLAELTRDLRAGEELSVAAPADAEVAAPSAEEDQEEAHAAAAAGWRRLSREGRHHDAYAQLGARFDQEVARAESIADLMALADVARLSGHPLEALEPLERASTHSSRDPRVVLAAFTKGRLEFEVLHDAPAAVASFRRVLQLRPSRSLEESARARLVESLRACGRRDEAQREAEAFVRDYPASVHLPRVQHE